MERKKLYQWGAVVLIVMAYAGSRVFKNNTGQQEVDPTQTDSSYDNGLGDKITLDNQIPASTPTATLGTKSNDVSTYNLTQDPTGKGGECVVLRAYTDQNPQTAFGAVRIIGDPYTFDKPVEVYSIGSDGGYTKLGEFAAGEKPSSDEWGIVPPGLVFCNK